MNEETWIVGCGDVGLRVARRLADEGGQPNGAVRSGQSAARLAAHGISAHAVDLDLAAPPARGAVYWLAPPPGHGLVDTRLRRWLASARDVRRVVYVSTSAVYGDCGGAWIDETQPLAPATARGHRRADAEQALAEWAAAGGGDYVVARVPGIYGPGRLPERRLRAATPLPLIDEAPWTNRIHADDLAGALIQAMRFGAPARAYHLADGQPTTMTDYFLRCAALLGLPPPPLLPLAEALAVMPPALASFMTENKRLRIERMREDLHVSLRYPDLSRGLPSCLPAPIPELPR